MGILSKVCGIQPAFSCSCPGVIGCITCWVLSAVTFAILRISIDAYKDCKAGCGVDCYSSGRNGITVVCNGEAEACFDACGNLQDNAELAASLNSCMDANCTDVCPDHDGREWLPPPGSGGRPMIPSDSFLWNPSNCTECRGDCEESTNVTGARAGQQQCIEQRGCEQVARDEWAAAQACVRREDCEGKGVLSTGQGGQIMMVLTFLWPIFGTLCCAIYKEPTRCSSPKEWSLLQWLGRCSCACGTALAALIGIFAGIVAFEEYHPAASLGLLFAMLAGCLYNFGALLLVGLSRLCFACDGKGERNGGSQDGSAAAASAGA